jgi:hypothetical protein
MSSAVIDSQEPINAVHIDGLVSHEQYKLNGLLLLFT